MTLLRIDIETYSETDLRSCGVSRYAQDPSFEVLLFAYAFDDAPVQVVDLARGETLPLEIVYALSDKAITKAAWNAQFEITCLSRALGAELDAAQWRCSMVASLYAGLPASLSQAGEALGLSDEHAKDRVGGSLIRYFCIPCRPTIKNGGRTRNLPRHDPDKWSLFKRYCAQDVVAEREISKRVEEM